MKEKLLYLLVSVCFISSYAQTSSSFFKPSDSLNISRRNAVLITETALLGGGLVLLNRNWYNDKEKTSFHFNKDQNGWGLMDKAAHGFATYQLTRFSTEALQWSGMSNNKSLLYGTIYGLGAVTAKELMDAHVKEWGWSWYDYGFNIIGSGLYVGQELLWKEQRIQPKFSYNNSKSKGVVTENVGDNYGERLFKNYDGQTFWLSFNLNSFAKTTYIPNWLNFSVGYGVDGYLTNRQMAFVPQKSKSIYLSLDADLTKIKTQSHFLRTLFSICNTIKIPAPTIEFNSKRATKGHVLYF